ncbi:MAG TPA: hypothetical protein VET87_24290 [Rubrivivax sp.]|jgi:hypothetical protein|nr:hypothetical protein [Rubrivivax sp.]
MALPGTAAFKLVCAVLAAAACSTGVRAQSEGGLYIAGAGFSFQVAADRAMAQNAGGRRFFLLSLPPESRALATTARPSMNALRNRVLAANGVLLVCQRDIDNRSIPAATLASGVVAVRGWPGKGDEPLPDGERYFANESRAHLPADNEALRRLRSACA